MGGNASAWMSHTLPHQGLVEQSGDDLRWAQAENKLLIKYTFGCLTRIISVHLLAGQSSTK